MANGIASHAGGRLVARRKIRSWKTSLLSVRSTPWRDSRSMIAPDVCSAFTRRVICFQRNPKEVAGLDVFESRHPMFILSEKIAPPTHNHTLSNERAAEEARLKRSLDDDEDRWVKNMVENLVGYARKIGMGRSQRH